MKPFNLEEFKNGAIALDRNGDEYRFIALDNKLPDQSQLIAARKYCNVERVVTRHANGKSCNGSKSYWDLAYMKSSQAYHADYVDVAINNWPDIKL